MKARGFTLIELLVVISIVAILATVVAPSYSGWMDKVRARKTSDFLTQLINTARSEALQRNANVYLEVTPTTFCLGTSTPCTGNIRTDNMFAGVTVSSSASTVKFDNVRGLPPSTGATYEIKTSTATDIVTVNMLGLVKVSGGW